MQPFVLGKEIENRLVGPIYIFWIPGKCDPAKWSFTFAEEWANICRDKSREGKGAAVATLTRFIADRIAVIKYFSALIHEANHRFNMLRHRFASAQGEIFGVIFGELRRIMEINTNRDVGKRIVGRSLVCHDINGNIHGE